MLNQTWNGMLVSFSVWKLHFMSIYFCWNTSPIFYGIGSVRTNQKEIHLRCCIDKADWNGSSDMCKPTYSLCSVHPEAVPGTALAAGKGSSFGSPPWGQPGHPWALLSQASFMLTAQAHTHGPVGSNKSLLRTKVLEGIQILEAIDLLALKLYLS